MAGGNHRSLLMPPSPASFSGVTPGKGQRPATRGPLAPPATSGKPRTDARMAGPQGGAPPCGNVDWAPDLRCAASGVTAVARQGIAPGGEAAGMNDVRALPLSSLRRQGSSIPRKILYREGSTSRTRRLLDPGLRRCRNRDDTRGDGRCRGRWKPPVASHAPSPASLSGVTPGKGARPRPGAHWHPQRQAESPGRARGWQRLAMTVPHADAWIGPRISAALRPG